MSPPRTATWATPPTASSCGLMVQSAMVRSSSREVPPSAVSPIMSTSPRMDDCGPRVGVPTFEGSWSPRVASFSETICRSR